MVVDASLPAVQAAPPAEPPPLRRNLKFQVYWIGATAGGIGLGIAALAFPLLILAMTGSPGQAAAFGAVQAGTQLVLGMPAGALADRTNRRLLLIVSELMRCASAAAVVVGIHWHRLGLAELFAVAVVLGGAQALGAPSRALVLRAIVPPTQLTQALSQDEVRVSAAGLLGPLAAGTLYGLARIAPFLSSLAGFLISLCSASLVRFDGKPVPSGRGSSRGGALIGLRFLWQDRALRWITATAATLNLAGAAVIMIVIVMLQRQHYSSGATGFALAGEAAGGLLGAVFTTRLHRWMQPGRLLLTVCWLCVPLMAALVVPAGPVWIFVVMFGVAAGMPALMVMIDILVFRQVPDDVRGRVIAGTFTAFGIGAPLGSAVAGLLLDAFSPQVSILIVCALISAPLCMVSKQRSLRDAVWPN